MANTKIITMTGFVEYARVFEENMDDNMDFHGKTQGQYNMNFYPESDAELKKFFDAGAPESAMGHDTIKIGNPDLAMGKYVKLKRPNVHPAGIADFGGAPKVFDFRDGPSATKWDFGADGELGNGSKVHAKVSIYGNGQRASIRLERIAVVEQVVFEGNDANKEDVF